MPKYMNGFLDMQNDPKCIMPSGFDRNMCIICTPERLHSATTTLILRDTGSRLQTFPDECRPVMESMVDLCSDFMDFMGPFLKNIEISELDIWQRKMYRQYFQIKKDCEFIHNSDEKLINLKNMMLKKLKFVELPTHGNKIKGLFKCKLDSRKRDRDES